MDNPRESVHFPSDDEPPKTEWDVLHHAKLMESIERWNALSQEERDRINDRFAEDFAAAEVLYADELPEWLRRRTGPPSFQVMTDARQLATAKAEVAYLRRALQKIVDVPVGSCWTDPETDPLRHIKIIADAALRKGRGKAESGGII